MLYINRRDASRTVEAALVHEEMVKQMFVCYFSSSVINEHMSEMCHKHAYNLYFRFIPLYVCYGHHVSFSGYIVSRR